MIEAAKLYSENGKEKEHLEIEGVKASSQDFNQSIYRTLDRKSLDFFWSSTGSDTNNVDEYLVYKIASASMMDLNPRAIITSIVLASFRPRFHPGSPLYPPHYLQFEIGDTPNGPYDYRSPIYLVD